MQDVGASVPGRYSAAIAVMKEMAWSWADLCNAPADLVDEIGTRMTAQAHWQERREKFDAQKAKARSRK